MRGDAVVCLLIGFGLGTAATAMAWSVAGGPVPFEVWLRLFPATLSAGSRFK